MVGTPIPEERSHGWDTTAKLAIARSLLAAQGAALTARDLSRATGIDQSNVKGYADAMVEEGLLHGAPPPAMPTGTKGRRATAAYLLPASEREAARRALAEDAPLGHLGVGTQLVYVDADDTEDLFALLADPRHLARASWFALIDGRQGQEYVIAFSGPRAAESAVDLLAVLKAARVPRRRAHVTQIDAIPRLVKQADRAARAALAVKLQTDTRRPGPS